MSYSPISLAAGRFRFLELMRAALLGLPPRMRAVLVLRLYEDLTERQVADALGVSVGTVRSTAFKALAKLRADTHMTREASAP